MGISVLSLVKGRGKALEYMILGLLRSTRIPDELVIVLINEPEREVMKTPFPIRQIVLHTEMELPLAAARNLAARHATGSLLVFLDVDCIPAADLIDQYDTHQKESFLINGEVRYLPKGATELPDFMDHLETLSEPDPVRSEMDQLPHELFWSLNFACSAADYQKIGGFDEAYTGYGAEDTDFAFKARTVNIGMLKIPAMAYHQHHDSYSPPLNHLKDIINNARVFHLKWSTWPMEGWLYMFSDMGLLQFDSNTLHYLREPTVTEIQQALKS